MPDYTAMGTIMAPGTNVAGYRRGDAVLPSVVENWGLKVGEDGDVIEGPLPVDDPDAPVAVPRPDAGDNRATWEAYAIANGMSAEDAAVASQEDLEAVDSRDDTAPAGPLERPADSARKSEWVLYVTETAKAAGDDGEVAAWASDDSTTKADLQAWRPAAGDPVAESATEANQAS